ncbi:anion exchange family protein [Lasallia pustulata]|uniref:Anion exchange family protein n=1 Tax=Lasallia pustulata TaxID=136370 RepID=A0A1W5CXP1_9LECA|nr:anion exchange family protein [Lasallia pustulata]
MASRAMEPPSNTSTAPRLHPSSASHSSCPEASKKPWQSRSMLPPSSQPPQDSQENLSRQVSYANTDASSIRKHKWWRIRFFRGMINDVRRRAPFYWSDWTDAWDYRVVPATVYMYFAKYAL